MLGLPLRLVSAPVAFYAAAGGALLLSSRCCAVRSLSPSPGQEIAVLKDPPGHFPSNAFEEEEDEDELEELDPEDEESPASPPRPFLLEGDEAFDLDTELERLIAEEEPEVFSPKGWREKSSGSRVSCCCKKGKCPAAESSKAIGKRGIAARFHKDIGMCCKEKPMCKPTDRFSYSKDVRRCLPAAGDGRVHMCHARFDTHALHKFIDFGDSGCLALLKPDLGGYFDGTFVSAKTAEIYSDRDCPFADFPLTKEAARAENKARRALLATFANVKPASWVDVTMTCKQWSSHNASEGSWGKQGFKWEDDSFMTTFAVFPLLLTTLGMEEHEYSFQNPVVMNFFCSTLRLLPLMWRRMGMRNVGITEEETGSIGYPYSQRGMVTKAGRVDKLICSRYHVYSEEESALARRVLRALLPTYGLHVFAQTKHGMRTKGVRFAMGFVKSRDFVSEVSSVCNTYDDVDLVQDAGYANLVNAKVAERDRGTCNRRWPCAYADGICAEDRSRCKCKCFKAVCWYFAADFDLALRATSEKGICRRPKALQID